ncbi:hypothetical protein F2Q69_00006093 [Brassica cretica]|uniref:Uncharacterized protein n=1 Tax=Brassica cretica TaxID=69181 RepID=A0A8S9NWD0_BRACR|nr:hypothetical protein F2Q69_00006093 [Brassica cretica]
MDSNSYTPTSNFVDLLQSQQHTVFGYVQDSVELCSSQVPLAQSSTSHATETTTGENEEGTIRPPGVKASKGHGKKKMASDGKDGKALSEFQKTEPLAEYEEAPKKKLITYLLSN